jgi:hypothetical protein
MENHQPTLSRATCFAIASAVTVSSIVVSGFIAPNWYVKVSPVNQLSSAAETQPKHLRYSHIINPRQISAEKTRKISETMMRFCCWCKIRTPNRSPTSTYAQVNNDHSTACCSVSQVRSRMDQGQPRYCRTAHHNSLAGEAHISEKAASEWQKVSTRQHCTEYNNEKSQPLHGDEEDAVTLAKHQ